MAITQQTLLVLAFSSTSTVNASNFPQTKWHGITFTIVHSAVQKACCLTGPHPTTKSHEAQKHNSYLP